MLYQQCLQGGNGAPSKPRVQGRSPWRVQGGALRRWASPTPTKGPLALWTPILWVPRRNTRFFEFLGEPRAGGLVLAILAQLIKVSSSIGSGRFLCLGNGLLGVLRALASSLS